jgi:hypothetical protein
MNCDDLTFHQLERFLHGPMADELYSPPKLEARAALTTDLAKALSNEPSDEHYEAIRGRFIDALAHYAMLMSTTAAALRDEDRETVIAVERFLNSDRKPSSDEPSAPSGAPDSC